MEASLAASSRDAYATGLRKFRRFLVNTAAQLGSVPPLASTASELRECLEQPVLVACFLASLFDEGLAATTASGYLDAVRHAAMDLHAGPPIVSPSQTAVLKGFANLGPEVNPLRPHIDGALLSRMMEAIPRIFSSEVAAMLGAICTLAFFGCCRVSEYLHSSDRKKRLTLADIDMTASGQVIVRLKKTKNNQRGPAQMVFLSERTGDSCPVRAMRAFLLCRDKRLSNDAPLFSTHKGPLSPRTFNKMIKQLMRTIGVPDYQRYSTHSFRAGSATDAVTQGAPIDDVKAMGRWRSDAVHAYIRGPALQQAAARSRSLLLPNG